MTDKDARKELIRRANGINATVHIGKDGLDGALEDEINLQIKKKRLIKIKVLGTAGKSPKEIAEEIALATGNVAVDVRGGVIVLTDARTWTSLCEKKF